MKGKIDLLTIVVNDVPKMAAFYRDVLGFQPKTDMGGYIEFHHEGVRFAICSRAIMHDATKHASFTEPRSGQCLELAFPVATPEDVDRTYQEIVTKGATPIQSPADMPWGQRAAFFADPEGNIHEIFASLPA